MKITGPDVFGWYSIIWRGEVRQCFRTEKECRGWIADTARLRRAINYLHPPRGTEYV